MSEVCSTRRGKQGFDRASQSHILCGRLVRLDGLAASARNPRPPVADGQWPHLDQLWAHSNIDLVRFDNYMPLSDWTTGDGSLLPSGQSNNLDVANWSAPAAVDSAFDYERVTQSVVSTADYGAVSLAVSSSLDYGIVSAAASWPPSPPPASPNF